MGRLKGFRNAILMVLVVVVIESVGHRMDIICSGPIPEIFGLITFAALLGLSIAFKAGWNTLPAVFLLSVFYGISAFWLKLDYYYHDYPESLTVFIETIMIRAVFYSLPVLVGHAVVGMRAKRQMSSGKWR